MSQVVETRKGVSVRECARQLGLSDTAIRKAIKNGRCPGAALADGTVDVALVRAGMSATANPLRGGQRHLGVFGLPQTGSVVSADPAAAPATGASPAPGASSPADQAPAGERAPSHAPLLAARTLSEQTRAEREQIELRKLQGTVAEVDPMVRAVFDAMTAAHSALRALPDRLTPLVTPETDPVKVYSLIEEEVGRIVTTLHDDLKKKAALGEAVTA